MSRIVDEHRLYLSDHVRLDAFRRAITEVVRPGAVVVDLASGTGILGLFACQAGASRVYSVEVSGITESARVVADANGFGQTIISIHGHSPDVSLPERVDAIICDQIGHFGIEAGLIESGCDARNRWLKPGGVFMPSEVDLFVAPIEAPDLFKQVEFWEHDPAGFDFSAAREWAANSGYPTHLSCDGLLGSAARLASFSMLTVTPAPFTGCAQLTIERPGTLHGIGGWFSARLSPSVTLSNGPTAEQRLNRRNVFFPIDRAVSVEPGDVAKVRMHINPADTMVTWTVDVWSGTVQKAHFRHSTLNGMLMCREDLRRMDPTFVPSLTRRGRARLTLLELCDGRRPLADIEREVYDRHPDLFQSVSEAGAFVAEVVTRYSR